MIVSLANVKGGVGKTTGAIMLAVAATRAGTAPVRVLDADPQSSASEWAARAEEDGAPLPFEVAPANATSIRRLGRPEGLVVIDLPPSGKVVDVACSVSDLVIVPCGPKPAEVARTWETVQALQEARVPYAVLVCRKDGGRRLAYESMMAAFEGEDVSFFETVVPRREALSNMFGHCPTDDLFGYDGVWAEVCEAFGGTNGN